MSSRSPAPADASARSRVSGGGVNDERGGSGRVTGLGDWLRHLPTAAVVLDTDGVALVWNPVASDVLGWTSKRSLRRLGGVGVPWFDRLLALSGRDEIARVAITRKRDGMRAALELEACRLASGDLLVLLHDVTPLIAARRSARRGERRIRRLESVLHASHQRLRLITDMMSDHAAITLDDGGAVVSWNAGAQRVTGFDAADVMNRPFAALQHGDGMAIGQLLQRAASHGRDEAELELRRPDDHVFRAHVSASPLNGTRGVITGYVLVLRDLTESLRAAERLRRSELQLQQAEKMDAVGRLAAGIAHDFNNVLTAIHGHVEFLLEQLPSDMDTRTDVEEIRLAADRAGALTRQLLTFARKQVIAPVAFDVNRVIRDVEKLLRRLMAGGVTMETALADRLPLIFADPGQIEQVLVNLIVNARDAMTDGGTITIRTAVLNFEESYSAAGLEVVPGEYVQLTVSDTGEGMTPDVQRQIFEPFFTTKREGTGLGLSNVYGIVKQSGGHISVYSERGVGTTFKLYFPAHTGAAPAAMRLGEKPDKLAAAGTVLLVEDDDAVRGLARRTLQGSGYTVLEAREGEEALDILRQQTGAIDAVITDVNMPKMSGFDLAQHVAELYPRAGVVIMSGFPEDTATATAEPRRRRRFLEKPFTPVSLVRAVREAMEE